jgi:hypothetical protein
VALATGLVAVVPELLVTSFREQAPPASLFYA